MFKYFSANSTRKYIDILDEFVNSYNNTNHSSIKITPSEASKRENENEVWRNLYGDYSPPERKTPKFQLMIKSESLKRNLFLTRGIHHAGPKRFLQFQKFTTQNP